MTKQIRPVRKHNKNMTSNTLIYFFIHNIISDTYQSLSIDTVNFENPIYTFAKEKWQMAPTSNVTLPSYRSTSKRLASGTPCFFKDWMMSKMCISWILLLQIKITFPVKLIRSFSSAVDETKVICTHCNIG